VAVYVVPLWPICLLFAGTGCNCNFYSYYGCVCLLLSWSYCKCEMPYNPDDLMVQCDACKDW
jgi:hypothetical protein